MKKKVLIIEDNEDIQEIYKLHFEAAGCIVYSSTDGLKGIMEILDKNPDVVLLDIMMPQMNGFEVLQTITEQSSLTCPIIACSNLSQKSDIEKAFELGADKFLVKSDYTGEEIVEQVLEFIS